MLTSSARRASREYGPLGAAVVGGIVGHRLINARRASERAVSFIPVRVAQYGVDIETLAYVLQESTEGQLSYPCVPTVAVVLFAREARAVKRIL